MQPNVSVACTSMPPGRDHRQASPERAGERGEGVEVQAVDSNYPDVD